MTQTIFENTDFTFPAGLTTSFVGPMSDPGPYGNAVYVLSLVGFPANAQPFTFTVGGAISVTDDSPSPIAGIEDEFSISDAAAAARFIASARVIIASTGSLTVAEGSTPGTPSPTVGYLSSHGLISFENDGTLSVSAAGLVYGAAFATGSSTADAPHPAMINTGAIHVFGPTGAGVLAGDGVVLTNSGSITAQGGAEGVAVGTNLYVPSFGGPYHSGAAIANSGAITVTGGSTPSVGIGINANSGGAINGSYAGEVDVTNSGTITAAHAIELLSGLVHGGGPLLVVHNSGTLLGSVVFDFGTSAPSQIVNSGAIVGDVQLLSSGDSLYDGRGGTLSGTLTLGGGHATVYLGAEGEKVQGGSGDAVILGGPGIDTITGGSGNDVIDGGGGSGDLLVGGTADVLDGGGGVNTASFASSAFSVAVSLTEQNGFQDTGINRWVFLTNFQNLIGSAQGDLLSGDAGNNVIDGGGGGDFMYGGGGVDTVSYASAKTGVTVSLALQGQSQATGVGNDTITGFQNLTGSAFNDTLEGINGSVLNGGGGSDTASFAHAAGGVTVSLALPGVIQNTGGDGTQSFFNIQNLTGSAFNDTLEGIAGSVLDGAGGTNTVSYAHASAGVAVSLALQGVMQNTGGDGIEGLFNFRNIIGSAFNDTLEGIAGSVLDGGGGINTASFAHAASGVSVSLLLQGQAQNTGGDGTQTLTNFENLTGSAFDDHLAGDANANVLNGDGGADVLTGGGGADTFVLQPGYGADEITDFSHAQGDKIDLTAIAGLNTFGALLAREVQVGPNTVINLPGGGTVTLDGVAMASLQASDFILHAAPASTMDNNFGGGLTSAVAFVNSTTGDLGYMTANATGGETWHPVGPTSTAYSAIAKGDFNGDGVLDIAFRNNASGGWGFMSVNPGGGETWRDVGPSSLAYASLGSGNFGGDGQIGIAFRSAAGDWGYMTANSSGGETWHGVGATSAAYSAVGVGDFDGSGHDSIAFRNNATGDFGYMSANPSGGEAWHPIGPTGTGYAAVGFGDFNADGVLDVAFRNIATGDWGFMSINPGGGETWRGAGPSSTAYSVIGSADYNGDGLTDLAFRNAAGDWGYMSYDPSTGGEIWHGVGPASTAYMAL